MKISSIHYSAYYKEIICTLHRILWGYHLHITPHTVSKSFAHYSAYHEGIICTLFCIPRGYHLHTTLHTTLWGPARSNSRVGCSVHNELLGQFWPHCWQMQLPGRRKKQLSVIGNQVSPQSQSQTLALRCGGTWSWYMYMYEIMRLCSLQSHSQTLALRCRVIEFGYETRIGATEY